MSRKKASPPSRKNYFLFGALLLLVTFGLYFQVTNHEFVNYDDDTLITSNRLVVDPGLPASACFEWNIFTPHFKPLVLLSWRTEYQLSGGDPFLFHFNNMLLHALNVLLVFIVSFILLKKFLPDHKEKTPLAAFFVALAFAVHPLHVESVAWAVERKDVLYTFFFLFSWWAYLQFLEKTKYVFLLLSAALYGLVILTKSMGITLIAVLFLTDYAYDRKNILALIKEKIPHVLIFILGIYLYGLASYLTAFVSGGAVGNATNIPEAIRVASEANPILQLILMAFLKVFLLLAHVILPLHLSVIYEGPEIQKSLGVFFYAIPFVLGGLVYLAWRMREKHKVLLFGLLFFLITVSPAIAIGKYGGVGVFIGDRYTYAPLLGLLFPIVVFVFQIRSSFKLLPVLLLSVLCGIYMVISLPAIRVWKNSETLWTNAIEKTKCASPAYNGRGAYYLDKTKETDKALSDFSNAVNCDSTNARALYNRGLILMNKNKNEQALADYSRALRYNPGYVEAYVNRGNILRDKGRNDEAMSDYNTALRLSPEFAKGLFNRGNLFLNLKQYENAISDFSKAIAYDANYAKAYYNRGLAYYNMNNKEQACKEFNVALTLGYQTAAKTIKDHCK